MAEAEMRTQIIKPVACYRSSNLHVIGRNRMEVFGNDAFRRDQPTEAGVDLNEY